MSNNKEEYKEENKKKNIASEDIPIAEAVPTKEEEVQVSPKELSKEEKLTLQLKESEDKYLRSLADLENARRRFDKMREETAKYAIADFAKDLLSMLDIFKKAFEGVQEDEIQDTIFKNFLVGIRLTEKELNKIMIKFGVTKLSPLDENFDANFHEALYAKEDSTKEDNTICEIIEDGYILNGRLLRSAKVGIIKNSE